MRMRVYEGFVYSKEVCPADPPTFGRYVSCPSFLVLATSAIYNLYDAWRNQLDLRSV